MKDEPDSGNLAFVIKFANPKVEKLKMGLWLGPLPESDEAMSKASGIVQSCLLRQISKGPPEPDRGRLVFLHGAGSQSGGFPPLAAHIEAFSQQALTLETLDLPDHGNAPSAPAPETLGDYARRVIAVLESETEAASTILVGHSMGGAIAQIVARQRPDLIRGLIFLATTDRFQVQESILEGIERDYDGFLRASESFLFGPQTPLKWRRAMIFGGFVPPPTAEVTVADFRACSRYDARNSTADITAPALVIAGSDDVLIPEKLSRGMADRLKDAHYMAFKGTGHLVFLEECGGVAAAITSWIHEKGLA